MDKDISLKGMQVGKGNVKEVLVYKNYRWQKAIGYVKGNKWTEFLRPEIQALDNVTDINGMTVLNDNTLRDDAIKFGSEGSFDVTSDNNHLRKPPLNFVSLEEVSDGLLQTNTIVARDSYHVSLDTQLSVDSYLVINNVKKNVGIAEVTIANGDLVQLEIVNRQGLNKKGEIKLIHDNQYAVYESFVTINSYEKTNLLIRNNIVELNGGQIQNFEVINSRFNFTLIRGQQLWGGANLLLPKIESGDKYILEFRYRALADSFNNIGGHLDNNISSKYFVNGENVNLPWSQENNQSFKMPSVGRVKVYLDVGANVRDKRTTIHLNRGINATTSTQIFDLIIYENKE